MKKLLIFALASLSFSGIASANLIPSLVGSPALQGSGNYLWSYQATVQSDQRLDPAATSTANPPGTFFTIYDFAGFVNIASTPSGWTSSTSLTGLTPAFTSPSIPDNAAITNVTFSYTGPVVNGPATISGFGITSLYGQQVNGAYTQQATKNSNDSQNGTTISGQGRVPVPVAPAGVPEPASMMLIGAGLVGVAAFRRKFVR